MPKSKLKQTLQALRSELGGGESIGADERDLLVALRDDIEELLELSSEVPTERAEEVEQGLRGAVSRFQESHPVLSTALSDLANALAGMGI